MKRIIQCVLGLTAAVVIMAPAAAQTTLTFSNWIPPQSPFIQDAVLVWAKQVDEATSGRVKLRMLPKAVTSPPQHLDAVRDGLADVTFFVHGYTPGRFVLTKVAEIPFLGDSAVSTSVAYQRVYDRFLAKADEHKGVKVLSVFTHGPGGLFLARRTANSLKDLAGLKIRTSGGIVDEVGRAIGVSGMMKPATDVYEMLNSGVADGAFFSLQSILTFKLGNHVKQALIVPGGIFNNSFALIMNEAKFNSLSPADQQAIMRLSGERFARLAGQSFDDSDRKAVVMLNENKAEVTTAAPKFVEEIRQVTQPVIDRWIKQASEKGIDGQAALAMMRAEAKKVASE
jgi:TRAP-type C4-dicarboxylate transport system substrate-binding protein